jgi:predicted DNA binding CopG/RHH family protein
MSKKVPPMRTDEEAEAFLDQDLTEYLDFKNNWQRVSFEFLPKDKRIQMRFPEPLLIAIKNRAKAEGMSYNSFIRRALEQSIATHR